MALSLPAQLMLLGHDAAGGAHGKSQNLDFGAAGAILVELALAGRIVVAGRHLAVADATPTGDPLVDGALTILHSSRPRTPKNWVRKLSGGLRNRVLAELARSGVLRHERATALWIFSYDRYTWPFDVEPAPRAEARTQCVRLLSGDAVPGSAVPGGAVPGGAVPGRSVPRGAVSGGAVSGGAVPGGAFAGGSAADRRVVALCALVAAVGIDGRVFAELPRGQVRARLKEITAGDWAAAAVKKAIEDVQAAIVAAAVVASTTAATTSS